VTSSSVQETNIQEINIQEINDWNQWLSAFRETEEIRQQSWQMGRSLARLLSDLQPQTQTILHQCVEPLNFATVFALASAIWKIDESMAVLGYLQSWTANLVNAGVRLVPLGQTQGQQILLNLAASLEATALEALDLSDSELEGWSWGVSIASMNHETLYSRLFRS
jgi:urease accessory protein